MGNLIDGEVTERQQKKPALWRRFLAALDGSSRWSSVVTLAISLIVFAPIFLWGWWLFVVIAWGVGFAAGWWAARRHWQASGEIPRL